MKSLAFRLFVFALSRFTGTGWGQMYPVKLAYKYLRRMLLPKADIPLEIHGLKMYQHGREDYSDSDETLFTDGYERMETTLFKQLVKEGMTVVDIGANVGYYTLLACRNVGESGRVFAIEPEPMNYELLLRNIEENSFNNAVPLQKAISDKSGSATLYLSPKGHGEHSFYGAERNIGSVEVEVSTLDKLFVGNVDIVKIDIEGGEMLALLGMTELAKRSDMKLFIEFYPAGIQRSGYTPEGLWNRLQELGFEYIYIINEKKGKLDLADCDDAVDYCRQRTKYSKDEAISAVNLLCSKSPVTELKELKIGLLGAYPPPYGGISVHVQRLKERLDDSKVPCRVHVYTGDVTNKDGVITVRSKFAWFLKQIVSSRDEIIHCHGYSPLALVGLALLSFSGRKVVVTTHGFLFRRKIAFRNRLAFWIASRANIKFISTSHYVKELIIGLGVKEENVTDVIEAFIPPIDKTEIVASDVESFIDNHSPVIVANAYRIVFYAGKDLYGIDMCVELCAELKKYYPSIGLVFCLPDIGNQEYYDSIINKVRFLELEDDILFITKPCEFWPILKKCDLFVRPTNIDDFGVSVAEAIYFGIPAIASDVCQRAKGAILFKSRNMEDFAEKALEVLVNYDVYKEQLKDVHFNDAVQEIVEVYRSV